MAIEVEASIVCQICNLRREHSVVCPSLLSQKKRQAGDMNIVDKLRVYKCA